MGRLAGSGVDHGLIGPREVPRLWERHVLNCAVTASLCRRGAHVVDVGSGAGLPGIAMAIARPDLRVHLVEPLQRRTTWLEAAIVELGLATVTVHRGRAEAFAGQLTAPYATARAVARLAVLARWCLPLLEPGGEVLALKGRSAPQELAADLPELRRLGVVQAETVRLGVDLLQTPTTVIRLVAGTRPPGPGRRRGPAGRRVPRGRGQARR